MRPIQFIAFPLTESLIGKSNRFLEAASARDARAGQLFVEISDELTNVLIDILLLQPLEQAHLPAVGEKLVRVCASTGAKVSHMLSGKVFLKASADELQAVANDWQANLKDFGDGKGWQVSAPLKQAFIRNAEAMLAERGSGEKFAPQDVNRVVATFEQFADALVDDVFVAYTRHIKMGMITKGLLNTGVSSVKGAIHSVMHNVLAKFGPRQMADYVDHISQFLNGHA